MTSTVFFSLKQVFDIRLGTLALSNPESSLNLVRWKTCYGDAVKWHYHILRHLRIKNSKSKSFRNNYGTCCHACFLTDVSF